MTAFGKALGYPRRYAAALRTIRRARAVPGDASFDRTFEYASEIGVTQQPEEIRWLFNLLRTEPPRTVLEIGLDEGGTLFLWTRAATADAQLLSIDTRPVGPLGTHAPFPLARRRFAHSRQRIDLVMPADSHAPETRARVERLLAGRPLDFLFVDGDHSYDGVWEDFQTYSPLVRPGGIVAFHDVSEKTYPAVEGVAQFWQDFKRSHETEERVVGTEVGFGIGVYRMPS